MPRVYQRKDRGNAWYAEFRWRGKRYREYAGPAGMKKSDADQFLAKRKVEVAKERIYGPKPGPPVSFATFADNFLVIDSPDKRSKDRDVIVVKMLKVEWKGRNLRDISTEMIEGYKARRLKHRANATVALEVQVIKRLFKKAAEWGKQELNPSVSVKKPRVNNTRVRFLEPEEMERFMAKLPAWLQVIANFARFTGARRGEILNLTWNDVDYKRGWLTFRETKNGEDGHVKMNATVTRLLKSLPAHIDRSQRVFQLENRPAVWTRIGRPWSKAVKEARIEDYHFHDLRHQAATDLLTLGATLNDVRDFLRHKSLVMTLRYGHLVEDRRKDTACLLDQLGAGLELAPQTATTIREGR